MNSAFKIDSYKYALTQNLPRPIESKGDFEYLVSVLKLVARRLKSTPEEKALAKLMRIALAEYQREKNRKNSTANPLLTLKAIMATNSISQAELSRILGVSPSAVSQIMNGKRGISKAIALKLAERFGVPVIEFLT